MAGCADRPLEDTGATEPSSSTQGEMTTGQPAPTTVTSTSGQPAPTTGSPEPTLTGTVTTASPATSEPSTEASFIDPSDTEHGVGCDGWAMPVQDCPEGEKCTVDGGVSETHCVEVVPDPKDMYEPCQILMGDGFSGHDDCGPGLICWDVDPDTGVGQCIGFCHGPLEAPSCVDPAASCTLCQECALGFCLPGCDPLIQDCPNDDLCLPHSNDPGKFVCVLDASGDGGQAFDPCEFVNACDKGLVCSDPALAAECDQGVIGCCLPLCDTTAPMCPGAGQECLPWFEGGMAPAGLENVGLCGLP